jgi:hypothetical protein
MTESDFPALYRSADALSLSAQKRFFLALGGQLVLLVLAAVLSVVNCPHWVAAVAQTAFLLGTLVSSIYLFGKRPDRYWYAGRAVAESIKTLTWRYVSVAEPFDAVDEAAMRQEFARKLKAVVDQNREVAQALRMYLGDAQITPAMQAMRSSRLAVRREAYAEGRIKEQLEWYARKAELNSTRSEKFFLGLIVVNAIAVLSALIRIKFAEAQHWPTDIFVAAAASLLSWMQAKRFSELASSYALAAHEISLFADQALTPATPHDFSVFVGDAENAFSREHTQWVARKDV